TSSFASPAASKVASLRLASPRTPPWSVALPSAGASAVPSSTPSSPPHPAIAAIVSTTPPARHPLLICRSLCDPTELVKASSPFQCSEKFSAHRRKQKQRPTPPV